jgi:hypothetical protein
LAGVVAELADGIAMISGSPADDEITVAPMLERGEVHVFDGPECISAWPQSSLSGVDVQPGEGDDLIRVRDGLIPPLKVSGGMGIDTVLIDNPSASRPDWMLNVPRVMTEAEFVGSFPAFALALIPTDHVHVEPGHDMSGMDHSGHDMSGMDMSGMDMSSGDMSGMDHSGHDMNATENAGNDMGSMDHSGGEMAGMERAEHDMSSMAGMVHAGHAMASMAGHAGHSMSGMDHSGHNMSSMGHAGHDMGAMGHAGHGDHAGHSEHAGHAGHAGHSGADHSSHAGHSGHAAHAGHSGHGDHAGRASHTGHEGHGMSFLHASHSGHGGHSSHSGHGDHAGRANHVGHDEHAHHTSHAGHNHEGKKAGSCHSTPENMDADVDAEEQVAAAQKPEDADHLTTEWSLAEVMKLPSLSKGAAYAGTLWFLYAANRSPRREEEEAKPRFTFEALEERGVRRSWR